MLNRSGRRALPGLCITLFLAAGLAGCSESGPPPGAPSAQTAAAPAQSTPETAAGEQREAQKEGGLQLGGGR